MNEHFGDLDYCLVYLDDILVLSNYDETWEEHLAKCKEVLQRLNQLRFKVNLVKSEILKSQLDYLGYTLTPHGIKPQTKKVEAIQRILPPKNTRQLKRFLGMINYYRDMCKRRSHILAPLTAISGSKKNFKWTEVEQKAFEEAKRMVEKETLLVNPLS